LQNCISTDPNSRTPEQLLAYRGRLDRSNELRKEARKRQAVEDVDGYQAWLKKRADDQVNSRKRKAADEDAHQAALKKRADERKRQDEEDIEAYRAGLVSRNDQRRRKEAEDEAKGEEAYSLQMQHVNGKRKENKRQKAIRETEEGQRDDALREANERRRDDDNNKRKEKRRQKAIQEAEEGLRDDALREANERQRDDAFGAERANATNKESIAHDAKAYNGMYENLTNMHECMICGVEVLLNNIKSCKLQNSNRTVI